MVNCVEVFVKLGKKRIGNVVIDMRVLRLWVCCLGFFLG